MKQKLIDQSVKRWSNISNVYQNEHSLIPPEEKEKNEQDLENRLEEINQQIKKLPNTLWPKPIIRNKIIAHFQAILNTAFPYPFPDFKEFLDLGFFDMTVEFYSQSKKFDPGLKFDSIFQAIRNVWVMGILQGLFDKEIKLTPTIYSYSLLYPYSDNYLDDPSFTTEEKNAFNKRFKNWVFDRNKSYINDFEKKMLYLVEIIHQEFPVDKHPKIYEQINELFKAQEKSLSLQNKDKPQKLEAILRDSLEKGGVTVLANQEIVSSYQLNLNKVQILFNYGMIFQLIDDLQDIEEDLSTNSKTLFTELNNTEEFDNTVYKLKNIILENIENTSFSAQNEDLLLVFVHFACFILIDMAIAENQEYFSKEFLSKLESFYPISLNYLGQLENKIMEAFGEDGINNLVQILS